MRLQTFTLPIAALCCVGSLAEAQYLDSPFSYNYLDLNYTQAMLRENPSPDLAGYGSRLSIDSPEGIRLLFEWDETKKTKDDVHFRRQDIAIGVGFMSSQTDLADMVLDIKYLRGQQDVGTRELRRNGYGIELGMRTLVADSIEFDFSGEFRSYFSSELGGRTSLRYVISDNISIGLRYTYFEKTLSKWNAGLRFSI